MKGQHFAGAWIENSPTIHIVHKLVLASAMSWTFLENHTLIESNEGRFSATLYDLETRDTDSAQMWDFLGQIAMASPHGLQTTCLRTGRLQARLAHLALPPPGPGAPRLRAPGEIKAAQNKNDQDSLP